MRAAAFTLALSFAAAAPVAAHDVSYSHAELRVNGARVTLALAVHRDDAARLLVAAAPDSLLRSAYLAPRAATLAHTLAPRFDLRANGAPLALVFDAAVPDRPRHGVLLRFHADAPRAIGDVAVQALLFPDNNLHETFLDVYTDGRLARQAVLSAEHPGTRVFAASTPGVLAVLGTFIAAGVHHIFIGPDHILFIFGLLLLGGSLAQVLKVATSFTLAHSITLALAALGIANVPSRIVEPVIALSIVYVAIENIRARKGVPDWRTRVAFVFGLVHGFGFASVLREFGLPREALGWSLLGFNVGVELGQASIVLAVVPVLAWLRAHSPQQAGRVVVAASWVIAAIGAYWFVQRVLTGA
jgi:hydrogenase/urease accessory protein HupE